MKLLYQINLKLHELLLAFFGRVHTKLLGMVIRRRYDEKPPERIIKFNMFIITLYGKLLNNYADIDKKLKR